MRQVLALAWNDLAVWLHNRSSVAAALVAPLGMGLLVALLTLSVSQQPVALVVEGRGPLAAHMAHVIAADAEAYQLTTTDRSHALRALRDQSVAAVLLIPSDFDRRVAADDARVSLLLNNVDTDFSDDIRRTVTRSVAEFDAPDLGILGELRQGTSNFILPNPYRVDIAEHNLRQTNVGYLQYQAVPVVILLVLNIGVLGSAVLSARDFESGMARVAMLAPLSRTRLVLGRALGGVLAALALLVPVVLAGAAVGWIRPPLAHWPALVAILGAVTIMAVGLGLLLGTTLRRVRLVTMVALNVATYLYFLGGGFTTIAFLPDWIQAVSRAVPTSYAISGIRQVLFYPDLDGVGLDLVVLALCAAATLLLGVASARRNLRRM
ncbi:MAG: ABC transporter permease [Candidatus Dormibacteria bacterium]